MKNIKVTYDGEYPNACAGTITIEVDGLVIYKEKHVCGSTGGVSFDDDWEETVTRGELVWNDVDKFPQDIVDAVNKELSKVEVCCGGCV